MEEHRLKPSDSSVLRKNFGPKLEELRGAVRKLNKLELQDILVTRSPDISSVIISQCLQCVKQVAVLYE
jgi:hypothetical protein